MGTFGGKGEGQRAQESCAGRKMTPSKGEQGQKREEEGDGHVVKMSLASSTLSVEGALPCHSGSPQEGTAPGFQLSH